MINSENQKLKMKNLTGKTFIAFISIFGLSLLLLALPEQTQANGGTIIFPQNNSTGDVGPFNVLVTETPSPPGPDTPVHLSVLLTRAKSDLRVTDASLL